jgi:DNA polymerase-3 subunit alpha
MSDFVHLHVHSHYSLMDGLCSPNELLSAAKDIGQTALAITDHGTLSSHREMQQAAKEVGLKPILGVEAYISETDRFDRRDIKKRDDNTQVFNHIILLAKNQVGLSNLQTLSEMAWAEGYYRKPRIDMEILGDYGDGIIVLSGCMNGMIAKAIEKGNDERARTLMRWFKNRFDKDFYVEIQPHNPAELNHALLNLADEFNVAPIVTSDCHFATADQRAVEEALLILSTKPNADKDADFDLSRKMEMFERLNYLYPDRPISFQDIDVYIQNRAEITAHLKAQEIDRTDVYESTLAVVDSVGEYDYVQNVNLLPVSKRSANDKLREMCMEGMVKRGLDDPIYNDRLEEELTVIKNKKFAPYFLVVEDMINWAKSEDIIVGPGRGSAAGSLVCYLLGITEVDPIKYDLLFGRFINEERSDFPDIDTDFEDSRRGEVKEYLRKKYKNVASISTYQYFKDKGVVRDAARVFVVPLHEVNSALKSVTTFEEYEQSPNTLDFRKKYPEVTELARQLRGRIRGSGMHAAGIVVAKEPIRNYAPIETRKDPSDSVSGRIPVVAYDMEQAADIGLIKIDALGLKTLTVVSNALKIIKERYDKDIVLTDIPLNDPQVYLDLTFGYTKGVFQAEATPYTNLLMKMGVDNFEDLVASNALVRPGAMNTVGVKYIARKKGTEVTEYVHPIMQKFLQNTYGVIIYQEQVMQACVYLAGMSWADADKIRKIIGKKKDVHEFDIFKNKFVEGASKNIPVEAAEQLWHDFEAHAGYSFNRSHAVAYSMLGYWTAWLKHYYPLEFMFALLKSENDKDARTEYLLEAKRLGLRVLLPHANESDLDFSIQGNAIRFGLANIKFVSDGIGSKIIAARPFKSYEHLLEVSSTKGSGINSRAIAALNTVGAAAFDDNPRTGNESDNFYEYLNIPKFDTKGITPEIRSQISPLADFEERGCFVLMAMVKSIKRGKGWARVELVDDTGSVGIFHNENTQIETNNMYLFLVGDNRIHRYVTIEDVVNKKPDDYFIKYLHAEHIPAAADCYAVIDFTPYRTKGNKMMSHMIISDGDKKLTRVIAFPKNYSLTLGKMKVGSICEPIIGKLDDGTNFVKEIR